MRRSRVAAGCFAIVLPLFAQQTAELPKELHNNGDPMHAELTCSSDNLDWAGLSCSDDDPCAIYLELNTIASQGKRILVAGDLHAQSATLFSILLASDDDGSTWKEPVARVRGASLDQFQFLDATHGWLGGETVYPLPRDAFFLITSDGGESWRNRAVTDEGSPGSIQRFLFDSPGHGQLLIDAGEGSEGGRYKQYETSTSGDSWTLRSTSATPPPKMPVSPQPEPEYRLSSGKDAYRIERRTGTKWMPVASFAVLATTCKSDTAAGKDPN